MGWTGCGWSTGNEGGGIQWGQANSDAGSFLGFMEGEGLLTTRVSGILCQHWGGGACMWKRAGGWEIKNPFDWRLGELISGNSFTVQGQQSSSTRAEVPVKAQKRQNGLPPHPHTHPARHPRGFPGETERSAGEGN